MEHKISAGDLALLLTIITAVILYNNSLHCLVYLEFSRQASSEAPRFRIIIQ